MTGRSTLAVSGLIVSLLLVTGCTTPYDIGNADPRVTPVEAAQDVAGMLNHSVAWGGLIAAAKNLKDKTELEVVGYPLDAENRPDSNAAPTGRFIVIQTGYLETADYAPGRLITVVGTVTQTRRGTVGARHRTFIPSSPRPSCGYGQNQPATAAIPVFISVSVSGLFASKPGKNEISKSSQQQRAPSGRHGSSICCVPESSCRLELVGSAYVTGRQHVHILRHDNTRAATGAFIHAG